MTIEAVLTLAQAAGALALLVGVWLLLPLYAALAADGALLLVLATAAEVVVSRAHNGRPESRQAIDMRDRV